MPMTIGNGRKTVTTGGTAVQLSTTSTPFTKLTITAETDNTNPVVVGGSTVVAALATRQGTPLAQGDSYTIEVKGQEAGNLTAIYIDAVTDTEGVTYSYINETWRNA